MESWWWGAPGLVVVCVSVGLTLAHVALAVVTRRPYLRLTLFAIWLRQIGFGILFLGFGASVAVPALLNGPDIGLIVFGALLAGFGGLSFIAATDPMFRGGPIFGLPLPKSNAKPNEPDDRGSA